MSSSDASPRFDKLRLDNYDQWKGEMQAWLMKMGLWQIVTWLEWANAPHGRYDF